MTMEEKIDFWTKSLLEDHSESNVERFVEDREHCPYSSMPCPLCSNGCFKINVMRNIDRIDKDLAEEITKTEMQLMIEPRNFD